MLTCYVRYQTALICNFVFLELLSGTVHNVSADGHDITSSSNHAGSWVAECSVFKEPPGACQTNNAWLPLNPDTNKWLQVTCLHLIFANWGTVIIQSRCTCVSGEGGFGVMLM